MGLPFSFTLPRPADGAPFSAARFREIEDGIVLNRTAMNNIAVALGGTAATELPTLLARGTFTPTFDISTDITYTTQVGEYWREGQVVHVNFGITYQYTGSGRENDAVQILAPFTADLDSGVGGYTGVFSPSSSVIGTATLNFPADVIVSNDTGGANVFAVLDGTNTLLYGSSNVRSLVGQIRYRHTGNYNY
jgi:hypothetical protein